MNKSIVQSALAVIGGLFMLTPISVYIQFSPIYLSWQIVWACCFVILAVRGNLFVRGLLFLVLSVALAAMGKSYGGEVKTEHLWVVEFTANIMIFVGSGVGGNFIAHYFIGRER